MIRVTKQVVYDVYIIELKPTLGRFYLLDLNWPTA